MKKKTIQINLGEHTKNFLLMAFPLLILKLCTLIAFLWPLEGGELIRQEAVILALIHAIGRGLVFMCIGATVLSCAERKREEK